MANNLKKSFLLVRCYVQKSQGGVLKASFLAEIVEKSTFLVKNVIQNLNSPTKL